MRLAPLFLVGLLAGCAPPAYVPDQPLPLDSNGLPPHYSLCVRNAALKSVAIYDVYYGCRDQITFYLAGLNGPSQQAKAEMADAMDKKGMDYAQRQVIDRHGEAAVRAALTGEPPPPKAANRPIDYRSAQLPQASFPPPEKPWLDCIVAQLMRASDYPATMPTGVVTATVASLCKPLYKGSPGGDAIIIAAAVEDMRKREAGGEPVVIDRKQMPPADRRF